MNFDWVKAPKNKEEEKEQFDKLYHMLVRLSSHGSGAQKEIQSIPEVKSVPIDEFTRLKMDILANFNGDGGKGVGDGGRGDGGRRGAIPPLETCRACDRSFYSKEDLERHLRCAPPCREWIRRDIVRTPSMDMPFFSFMEEGIQALLGPGGKSCRFCEKPVLNRRAQEKHLQNSILCNRLAHDSFRSWYQSHTMSIPAPLMLLPPPSSSLPSSSAPSSSPLT